MGASVYGPAWTFESGRLLRTISTQHFCLQPHALCRQSLLLYLNPKPNSQSFHSNISNIPCCNLMPFPFTPNHVQLITACYPPSANLLTSGPAYRPNSQELSRLTYYASNRPGKINKLTGELERRVRVDCKKAQAGNLRARAFVFFLLSLWDAPQC